MTPEGAIVPPPAESRTRTRVKRPQAVEIPCALPTIMDTRETLRLVQVKAMRSASDRLMPGQVRRLARVTSCLQVVNGHLLTVCDELDALAGGK